MPKAMDVDRMYANAARLGPNGPDAAADAIDDLFRQGVDWIELMKTVRQIRDVSLGEATQLVLAHDGWRRWVDRRINSDPACRKMAWSHMRHGGPDALIEKEGDRFRVRVGATKI